MWPMNYYNFINFYDIPVCAYFKYFFLKNSQYEQMFVYSIFKFGKNDF